MRQDAGSRARWACAIGLFFLSGCFESGGEGRIRFTSTIPTASPRGQLTQYGNHWGWTDPAEVFVPQLVMYATPPHFFRNPAKVDADIETFLHGHGFNGFHVFVSCRWFDLTEKDCRKIQGNEPEPDPRTFEALEMLISKTHAAGGMVHIWLWGDQERGQTPASREDWGGLMGRVERRLLSAIAERLGPLPGWSMGYGFDLDEWVDAPALADWRSELQASLPGVHLLGGRPGGPNDGLDHSAYANWNRGLDYASYEHHRPNYSVYRAALDANPDKPVMSEDRFRVLPDDDTKHYSLSDVRRGLWRSTMAGGVANIWGYLLDGGTHELGSAPFPNQAHIRAHFEFLRGRFVLAPERCAPMETQSPSRPQCLRSADGAHYLFYQEDARELSLDLSRFVGSGEAIAVDAKAPYAELPLGPLSARNQIWEAPHESDWAIAVGDYGEQRSRTLPVGSRDSGRATELRPPTDLRLVSGADDELRFAWSDNSLVESEIVVERAIGSGSAPGTFLELDRLEPDSTGYVDREFWVNRTYWYRLRATSESGQSVYSELVRVHTPGRKSELLIADLQPASYRSKSLFEGQKYYLDRDYTLATIPEQLEAAVWIQTRNDDKYERATQCVRFTVIREARVFVLFDSRALGLPGWLDDWELEGRPVYVDGDPMGFFDLFRQDFPAGADVILGCAAAPGAEWRDEDGWSNYTVAVVAHP